MSDEYYGYSDNTYDSGNNVGSAPENDMYGQAGPGPEDDKPGKKKHKGNGNGKKILTIIGSAVLFGLVAGLVFYAVVEISHVTQTVTGASDAEEAIEESQGSQLIESTTDDAASNDTASSEKESTSSADTKSVSQIASSCVPSVVAITCKSIEEVQSFFGTQSYETEGAGSGIIVQENDDELLIATNNHVVSGATQVSVCFNDDEEQVYEATIKGTDAANDLAVVSLNIKDLSDDTLKSIKVATIGDSDALTVGENVVCIGNALGYGQSVTSGVVSALNREVTIDNTTAKLIQTDAAINPGNSGGAMFNMKGELVGINSAKYASEEVEGMGYAIPITKAQEILNELMNRKTRSKVDEDKRGYLSIKCLDVSASVSEMYGLPEGVYVKEVGEGGAAEKAGMKAGDIITKFDGLSVTDRDTLIGDLEYYESGETVEIVVQRSDGGAYSEKTLEVTLGSQVLKDSDSSSQSGSSSNGGSDNGIQVPDSGSDDSGSSSDDDTLGGLFDFSK